MVTSEQFINGVIVYAENELMPIIEKPHQKVCFGVVLGTLKHKAREIFENLKNEKVVKLLGIIDDKGQIDLDSLTSSTIDSINRYSNGKFEFDGGALIGKFTFADADIKQLCEYIIQSSGGV